MALAQPSAAPRGPPLFDRSLRAAADAATSRSVALQPSTPWLESLPHPAGGSGHRPSTAARGPPLLDRSLRAAARAATAATSRSGDLQADCSRGSHLPVGGSGLQPANSTTLGPPSLARSPPSATAGCQCLTRGFTNHGHWSCRRSTASMATSDDPCTECSSNVCTDMSMRGDNGTYLAQ